MKKTIKLFVAVVCTLSLMTGCGNSDSKDTTDGEVNKSVENAKDTAEKTMDDSIDNVMTFFNDQKVKVENVKPIDKMEFAAYEGRTFTVDGNDVYLYRVKMEDENMKKVMNEAKEKGKVKVSIDNKETEYNASVNNGYLMLFNQNMDNASIKNSFDQYRAANPSTLNPSEGKQEENQNKPSENSQGSSNNDKEMMD